MKQILIQLIMCLCLVGVAPPQIKVDYRMYQSPVRNQANRGTCTAFALLAALETFNGFPSDLSEQYLYAQVKSRPDVFMNESNYQEGAFLHLYIETLQYSGTVREDQEPYNPNAVIWQKGDSNFEKMKKDLGKTSLLDILSGRLFSYKIWPEIYTYRANDEAKDIEWIKSRLDGSAKCIPVSYEMKDRYWAFHPATRDHKIDPSDFLAITDNDKTYNLKFAKFLHPDIIDRIRNGSVTATFVDTSFQVNSGHAVAIVGYDEDGFLIKNSWGTGWGENGYGWISFDYHRLFALEAISLTLGEVRVDEWQTSQHQTKEVNKMDIWLKSLPYEFQNSFLNTRGKGISISVVYHGNNVPPRFQTITYKIYDDANNLLETAYGNTQGIYDGFLSGYSTIILTADTNSFPAAHKLIAQFTTEAGQTFTNTYYNISAKNQEYRAE